MWRAAPYPRAGGDGPGAGGFCSMTLPLWTTVPYHQGLWPLDFRTTFAQATPPPGTPSSHSLPEASTSSPPGPRPSAIRAGPSTDPACLPGTHRARGPCKMEVWELLSPCLHPPPPSRNPQWAGPWVSSQHPAQGLCSERKEQGGLPCPPLHHPTTSNA